MFGTQENYFWLIENAGNKVIVFALLFQEIIG
jgi:hypothetical protein